jgi:cupin 2 domain-containing protein
MTSSDSGNIYSLEGIVFDPGKEHVDRLYTNQHTRIKRILSKGHITPSETWYDQTEDEWVVLIQGNASLEFENGNTIHLKPGDYLKIDSGIKHRVSYTSKNPPCIWLAVYMV